MSALARNGNTIVGRGRQDNVREILAAMRKIPRCAVDHPVLVRAADLFGDSPVAVLPRSTHRDKSGC